MEPTKVLMNNPSSIGAAILHISKSTMARFHYNFIIPEYGIDECEMLYTDIDSLIYSFSGNDDIYAEIKKHIETFDTSDYPLWNRTQK